MDEMLYYRRNAKLANLCKKWDSKWAACHNDKEKLVRLALQQQSIPHLLTFAYQGKGLSKDFLVTEYKDYINGRYTAIDVDGVEGDYKSELYVGDDASFCLFSDVACFMYSNIPSLEIINCKATKLYCGCSSEVHIVCGGYNSITIMLFDDSKVFLEDVDENSMVTIYKYSDICSVEREKYCLGKIKEFHKELRI